MPAAWTASPNASCERWLYLFEDDVDAFGHVFVQEWQVHPQGLGCRLFELTDMLPQELRCHGASAQQAQASCF